MSIYSRIITADYPMMDMELKEFKIHNYSYREVSTAIQVDIWNRDILKKQTVQFTEEEFVEMMMEKEEGEYLYPETAEELERNGGDVNEAFEEDLLNRDEVQAALRMSWRIDFRLSYLEVEKCMNETGWSRKEAINHLVAKKTEKAPMPVREMKLDHQETMVEDFQRVA